ncbi:hypothetical protein DVH05_003495 [Phytophthora capsici]|nr:hypothetical protein DVH05_003495 [Phytophthora capsici]
MALVAVVKRERQVPSKTTPLNTSRSPTEYGFFSLQASKDWLKLQYHTTDNKWNFTENWADATIGGVETNHCWYIPADGSEGRAC